MKYSIYSLTNEQGDISSVTSPTATGINGGYDVTARHHAAIKPPFMAALSHHKRRLMTIAGDNKDVVIMRP